MEFAPWLHSVFVHFPIALLVLYPFFEIFALFVKKREFELSAILVLFSGIIFSVLSVLTGNNAAAAAMEYLVKESAAEILMRNHEQYATYTVLFFTGLLFLRFYVYIKNKYSVFNKALILLLAAAGIYLLFVTGRTGGRLVYVHGIGTEPEIKSTGHLNEKNLSDTLSYRYYDKRSVPGTGTSEGSIPQP